MGNIKDRELLTFSNTTNLDWQFAKLIQSTNIIVDKNGREKEENVYYKLNTLLTPESFVREDKEKNFIGYPYMPNERAKD